MSVLLYYYSDSFYVLSLSCCTVSAV